MTSSIACKSFFFLIYFFIVHQTQGFSLNRNNNNVVLQNLKDNFGPIQVHYDKLIHDDCSRRTFVSSVALSASALLLSPKTAKAASTVTQTIDCNSDYRRLPSGAYIYSVICHSRERSQSEAVTRK